MALAGIITGSVMHPPRVVVSGQQGVGKTTFGASARAPIFLPVERGADVAGPDRFPLLESYDAFLRALGQVVTGDHTYQTIVVDSLDWLERLIADDVAKDQGVKTIDDIGYGKGWPMAVKRWKIILDGLDRCTARGMAVILVAHVTIRRFDSPETEPYDRYTLKLHEGKGEGNGNAAALIREWADVVGYMCQRVVTTETDAGFNKKVVRGKSTGKIEMHVVGSAAYDAKNRYGIKRAISIPDGDGWSALEEAIGEAAAKKSARNIASSTNPDA